MGAVAGGELADLAVSLRAAVDRVVAVTAALWATVDGETGPDVEGTLANATVYLEAVGHVVVAWLWLEQVLAAAGKSGGFYDGKRQAARYFYRWELPKTGPQFDLLASRDRTVVDMNPDWF